MKRLVLVAFEITNFLVQHVMHMVWCFLLPLLLFFATCLMPALTLVGSTLLY